MQLHMVPPREKRKSDPAKSMSKVQESSMDKGQVERWLPVVGFEGKYVVSDRGRVKNVTMMVPSGKDRKLLRVCRQRVLAQQTAFNGYRRVALCNGHGEAIKKRVHRLVLEAFVGLCPPDMQCSHENGIRTDNRLENLKWRTCKENHAMRIIHGTKLLGSQTASAKLKERDIPKLRLLLRKGVSQSAVAKKFGVARSTIQRIQGGFTWSHVAGGGKS